MSDLVKRLRDLAQAKHDDLSIGDEAAPRIAALEAAVTQCRTLSAMLKPQADRIAELEEELSIWRSVFPDIAPERVLPDRRLLLNRIAELEAALQDAARVLHKAGEQFTAYANQHAAKGTAGGDQKAATIQQWAQRCFSAHDAALEGGKS